MTISSRSEARKRMYRRRRITVGVAAGLVLALLSSGVYTVAAALAPLPQLTAELTVEAETSVSPDPTSAQQAASAEVLPTAVGWLHGTEVWENSSETFRIASITKLVTVLVGLEHSPVEPGTDGPIYTVSSSDAALIDEVLAQDGIFVPAPVGLELTTRQLLDLILVPSANNYAIAYGRWIFGSDEAFLAATQDWLARHGLDSVQITEASGLADENVASAADIVRLARIALEDPLVAEIVAQSSVDIPGLGQITTTNRLLGEPGVVGVKTGTTFPSGYSLVAAQRETVTGRDLTAIAVTLDRPDADARANDTRDALTAMVTSAQPVQLVAEGEEVGTVTGWTGESVPLVAAEGAQALLVAGEDASRVTELAGIAAVSNAGESGDGTPVGVPSGERAGRILVVTPDGEVEIPVVTAGALAAPDLWWRLTHPRELFG